MPIYTPQQLVDGAVSMADMHDGFVTPTEWLHWYNIERRHLQLFMARMSGTALQNIVPITLVAPDVVTLATEYLAIAGVWELRNGRYRQLRIVPYIDNFLQQAGGPITGPSQSVSITDTNNATEASTTLSFFPRDPSGTYVVIAIANVTPATDLTIASFLPAGIKEIIELRMARRALIKEESDTTALDAEIARQERFIEEFCWGRAIAESPGVRNVDGPMRGWDRWDDNFSIPSSDFWVWF